MARITETNTLGTKVEAGDLRSLPAVELLDYDTEVRPITYEFLGDLLKLQPNEHISGVSIDPTRDFVNVHIRRSK